MFFRGNRSRQNAEVSFQFHYLKKVISWWQGPTSKLFTLLYIMLYYITFLQDSFFCEKCLFGCLQSETETDWSQKLRLIYFTLIFIMYFIQKALSFCKLRLHSLEPPVYSVIWMLRNLFIFKIVPMLNPDGVIVGNTRYVRKEKLGGAHGPAGTRLIPRPLHISGHQCSELLLNQPKERNWKARQFNVTPRYNK